MREMIGICEVLQEDEDMVYSSVEYLESILLYHTSQLEAATSDTDLPTTLKICTVTLRQLWLTIAALSHSD